MDAKSNDSSSSAAVTNGAFSVRCTQEVLLPIFTDESRQVTMETVKHNIDLHAIVVDSPLPELRLVLLGRKGAGKSSAGCTILDGIGGSEPRKTTEECVMRRADVWGRRVTVVDTPGWEWYYPLNSTSDWVRRETLRSATLCPPGPHALLLVVRSCASVTEAFLGQIAEHLQPLGEGVWDHTLVLFTRGDELNLASVEQRILSGGGRALRKLLEKCGNRYHVLDNRGKGDGRQVRELLRKTEEMAERGGHFGPDGAVLLGLRKDRDRTAEERRKKQRHVEEQMQREALRAAVSSNSSQESREPDRHSFSRTQRRLPELRLLLLGERETGKSSVGNAILGGAGVFPTGVVTEECVCHQAEASGQLVVVVDTPGWEAGVAGPTPERVKREMLAGASLCPPGPHAVLLALRVDTEVRAAPVREHLEPLGEGVWKHTLLLFTHGDQLREGVGIEKHVRSGGQDLRWLLEKCGGRFHAISSVSGGGGGGGSGGATGGSPGSTQVAELLEKVEKMVAGNRCKAFSSLVQEVGDLSRRRSEEFERRLAELRDKAFQQERELRKMREPEVKSVRRFFDRRRKIKSPGKAGVSEKEEEEEDEDRRSGDTKTGRDDVEERMRWLTEDKERELLELNTELDRTLAELHQRCQERQEVALKLEQKEAEIQEVKERMEEQQLQILDFQQASLEMDQERGQWDEIRDRQHEWATEVKTLKERIERCEHEKAGLSVQVDALRAKIVEMKLNHENACFQLEKEEERRAREKEEVMAEMKQQHNVDTERRIRENEKEVEKMKEEVRRASQAEHNAFEKIQQHEKDMEKKLNETVDQIRTQHQNETQRRIEDREEKEASLKLQHREDIARKVSELETLMESGRAEHRKEMAQKLKEKGEMEIKFAIRVEEQALEKEKEKERIQLKYETQLGQKLQEKESYLEELKREHADTIHRLQERLKDNDEFILNYKKEMEQRLMEKQREVEEMKLRMKEVGEMLEKSEKDRSNGQLASERNERHNQEELEELRRQVREMNEELQRKEEEAIQAVLCQKTVEAQKLATREQEVEELKLEMVAELNRKLQEKESEVSQRLEVREQEVEDMKLQMVAELNQKLQLKESEMAQKLQATERKIEEIKQQMVAKFNRKLQEKDLEVEAVRSQTEGRESKWMNEQTERDERGEKERNRLLELVEEKTQELAQMQQVSAQGWKELEEGKRRCVDLLGEIEQLEERHENMTATILEMQQRHDAKETEVLREKEAELNSSRDRERDQETEIAHLRQTIELTKSELKALTGQMEREMTHMIHEYEKEITVKNAVIETLSKEKEAAAMKLQQMRDGSEQRIMKMRERNDTIGKEMENVKGQFEEQEREQEAERVLRQSMEEKIKEMSARYEELAKAKEAAIKNVDALEEMNCTLRREIEHMAEVEREGRVEREEMQELHWRQQREEQDERYARAEGERLEMEREVKAREERLKQGQEKLEKRLRELDGVEEAVTRREVEALSREEDLSIQEADLEIKRRENLESLRVAANREEALRREEEDMHLRTQDMRAKEQQLDHWLEELENKRKELNDHGLDLQTKVQELKAWGKQLEGKEDHLKNRKQELLSWGAELKAQSQAMLSSKQQQLHDKGQNLAQAQEELYGQERQLKEMNGWEQCIEQCLESEHMAIGHYEVDEDDCFSQGSNNTTHKDASRDPPGSVAEGDQNVVAVDGQNGEGQRTESDKGVDQREEAALSATENKGQQFEMTDKPSAGQGIGGKEGAEREEEGAGATKERGKEADTKVVSDSRRSSPHTEDLGGVEGQQGQGQSELRVLVLGEARSSRCTTGVTVLGVASAPGAPWRGEIAGRRVALVEPLGLRWRDGPAGVEPQQRERVLRSASAFPGGRPHVVLLVVPAYLTCTRHYRTAVEEDVRALGGGMWRRTVVLLTWGEALAESAEQHILRCGDLAEMVERCGRRYHVMTAGKNHGSLIESLFEKMEEVVALNKDGQAVIGGEL